LYKAASDPKIWEQHPASDRYQRNVFEEFFQKAMESKGALKAIDNETKKIIGTSRYYDLDLQNNEVKIGWTFLERKYWGQPYNHYMKRIMIDHAFGSVDNVIFEIGETNIRSWTAIGKIGAKFHGTNVKDAIPHRIYLIQKSEWATNPLQRLTF
jgi:RimJ/RimL family protein N-acetyltransferase